MLHPPKHHRLWRRRLRRRPLLPFLLAATLACVLACLPAHVENPDGSEIALLFVGGTVALLGLSGVWTTSQLSGLIGRMSVAAGVVLLVGFALYPMESGYQEMVTLGLVVVIITAILGAIISLSAGLSQRGVRKSFRRYSIGFLMALTTFTIGAITLLQGLDLQVVQALTTDPAITGFLVAEVLAAPLALAISSVVRTTKVAAIAIALTTAVALIVLDCFITSPMKPAIWEPPHYYHLGLSLMTAVWLLGLRCRGRTIPPRANASLGAAHEVSGVTTLDATV